MKLEGQFWFSHQGRPLAGQDRIELLACIADTGSISKAAKAAGMSYKTAWDAVDAMNSSSEQPLVERAAGGRGGGGTRLTAAGEQLVTAFRRYQQEHAAFLAKLSEDGSLDPYLQVMNRLRLRTSARNQLYARVVTLQPQGLNDRVELVLDGGQSLAAIITRSSSERLGLCAGAEVFALIKAPWVKLASAAEQPNRLTGTVLGREQVGEQLALEVELDGGVLLVATLADDLAVPGKGEPVTLWIDPEQIILCAL
ncbi:MAG TPA: molybdenum-dependent transcriptional regulator [Pseudomonas sp.]|nr:molybdenum-dependent transcriptional regulator [Pseudomonas sp.]|tara:strand:+ start:473 stop:1234 length:762 start_codon:yes stop_codon:yes gene_type:complete